MKCETCHKIGKNILIDLLDDHYDKTIHHEIVSFISLSRMQDKLRFGDILKCPVCGTFYRQEYIIDNDIYSPRDEMRLTEISEDQAKRYLIDELPEGEAYSIAIRERSGRFIDSLSQEEDIVFRVIASSYMIGASLNVLKLQFPYRRDRLKKALIKLINKGLIYREIIKPHMPGKDEPGEEYKKVSDENVIYYINIHYSTGLQISNGFTY